MSWAHDDDQWAKTVAEFVLRLRDPGGVDADFDLFHRDEPGVDWGSSLFHAVRTCDFVLMAVSARYRESWDRPHDPHVGRGAAREAGALRGLLSEAPNELHPRTIVVMLPGATKRDIPPDLLTLVRFDISTIDLAGLEDLLRSIHDEPKLPGLGLGQVPLVPATLLRSILLSANLGLVSARRSEAAEDERSRSTFNDVSPPGEPSAAERDADFDRIVADLVLEIAPETEFAGMRRQRDGRHGIETTRTGDISERFRREYERLVGDHEPDAETIERAARIVAAEQSWRDGLGVMLEGEDVARLLNVGHREVTQLAASHEIIVLTTRAGACRFPAFQFQDGIPAAALARAHRTLVEVGRISPWSAASWARTPHPELELRSPAQWTGERRDDETLLVVAERDASRLAQ